MLFDRFDNMRSKVIGGGGGGSETDFDLANIGLRVTAQALSPIQKGNKWVGEKTVAGNYSINDASLTYPPFYASNDLLVGLPNYYNSSFGYSSINTYFYFLFWNSTTSNYDKYFVDFSSIESDWGIESGSYYWAWCINEEGTLAVLTAVKNDSLYTGNSKVIIFEIDKTNKIVTPRVFDVGYTLWRGGSGDYSSTIITKNCLFVKKSSGSVADYFVYDTENHNLIHKNSTITLNSYFFNAMFPQGNKSRLVWCNENTILIPGGNYIYKIVLGDVTCDVTSASVPNILGISNNGAYILNATSPYTSPSTLNIYAFNYATLTYDPTPISLLLDHLTGDSIYMDGNKIGCYKAIYELANGAITKLAETSSAYISALPSRKFNVNKWIAPNANKLLVFISSNADYTIAPTSLTSVTDGKAYGIASHSLSIGDIGDEQLLWETDTPI